MHHGHSEAILEALQHPKAQQAQENLLLGQAYQDHELVFCLPDGRPLEPRNFTRHFDRLLQQAGPPRIRFHDARHTFATLLLELSESSKRFRRCLGTAGWLRRSNLQACLLGAGEEGSKQAQGGIARISFRAARREGWDITIKALREISGGFIFGGRHVSCRQAEGSAGGY
jgi:hypothetical protein